MKRSYILALLILSLIATSCDNDYLDDIQCKCHKGGQIGGWEENDSTEYHEMKDSSGGFDVTVDHWGDSIHKKIDL